MILRLLNLIEKLSADLRESQEENQRLRDEINRQKGEQGKPKIKSNTAKPAKEINDHSSEKERQKRCRHSKGSKKAQIHTDREQVVEVDRASLPADAEFKGYADVVVQDILVKTDNIRFHREKYYAASTHKSYQAAQQSLAAYGRYPDTGGWTEPTLPCALQSSLHCLSNPYIHDRISGANLIPRLAILVQEAAKALNLGASWSIAISSYPRFTSFHGELHIV